MQQEVGHHLKEVKTDFVRKERSEGIIDVMLNGRLTPVFQESKWDEEESMTGLICRRETLFVLLR